MYGSPQLRNQRYVAGPTVSTPALLGQVLGIVGAGFLVSSATAYFSGNLPYGFSLIALLVGFGFLIGVRAARGNPGLSLLMFYAFAGCEGIGLGPVIANYARIDGPAVVVDAAATTGLGMLTLAAVVYLTSFDFRRLSGIAFGALIVLVIVGLISAFTHFLHPGAYAWATLGVFTLITLVDFARIKAGNSGATAVELATSIYLDAVNIFLALLEIFGARGRRD